MLVSVIVATYNCAHYIEATLDSVYRQTYRDIELIVTDDCSKDNTVLMVSRWSETHKDRFIRTVQTQTQSNSGVTANYNAGLQEARGEWIKCLDGDDLLTEDAIDEYVRHCTEQPDFPVWYANEQLFDDNSNYGTINRTLLPPGSTRKQMVYLLNQRLLGICTATNFIHREAFVAQGGFDSRYPMYQDGSPFLQALAKRNRIGTINTVTLLKRENPNSLMHTANPVMVQNIRDCHYHYARYYLRYFMPMHYYNAWLTYWISTHNTSHKPTMILGYFLRCFDIVNIYKKLCSSQS